MRVRPARCPNPECRVDLPDPEHKVDSFMGFPVVTCPLMEQECLLLVPHALMAEVPDAEG